MSGIPYSCGSASVHAGVIRGKISHPVDIALTEISADYGLIWSLYTPFCTFAPTSASGNRPKELRAVKATPMSSGVVRYTNIPITLVPSVVPT